MPFFKVTFFFRANQRGWTESWWREDANTDLKHIVQVGSTIAELRAQFLGNGAEIFAIRASNEDVKNDSFLLYEVFKPPENTIDLADLDIAILSRAHNPDHTRWKNTFLRGFWDSIEVQGGKFIGKGNAAFTKAFDAWATALADRFWAWKGRTKGAEADITGYTVENTGQVTVTVAANLFAGVAVGSFITVRIRGVNGGKSKLNGSQIVQVVSATQARTQKPLAVFPWVFGGIVQRGSTGFVDIVGVQAQRIVPRKSGAPLLDTPGRLKARARG